MYLYETHCHTNEASACAVNSGPEMARAYKAGGYAGIMVTNHFWRGNNCIDQSLPWEQWVRGYCAGYRAAAFFAPAASKPDAAAAESFFSSCQSSRQFS